jgi:hypothetical protein
MQAIKRILFLFSSVILILIVKEFLSLYFFFKSVTPFLGYLFIVLSILSVIYFAVIPIYEILKMSIHNSPVKDKSKIDELREKRIEAFKNNPFLLRSEYDVASIKNTEEDYNSVIEILSEECNTIKKRHINNLFYRTSISQNGFIDGMMILGSSVMLTKDIFKLYNGRVNNIALWSIAKKIYLSMLIGGSEGVEYASNEIFTKLASDTLKKLPFIDRIITSLTDGLTNAVLLTRVAIITENYCKMLYVESDKDLIPKPTYIISTAKNLTTDAINTIKGNLLKLAKNKTEDVLSTVVDPLILVWGRTSSFVKRKTEEKKKGFGYSLFNKIKR